MVYEIAFGDDVNELERSVIKFIYSGFKPVGGPFLSKDGLLNQAMLTEDYREVVANYEGDIFDDPDD